MFNNKEFLIIMAVISAFAVFAVVMTNTYKFGVSGTRSPSNTFATVGTSSSMVVTGDSGISQITFSNDSTSSIYISKGSAAVVGSGIFLAASGGTHTMIGGASNIWRGNIFAISGNGSSSNLAITIEYNNP